nr:PREDICTED: AF4/FMR2 family member 1 isoform X2 [Latimeria chalumnae]|eukprot:XP_014351015.1 PREDICTED: AF4/FMR2 family member 1 isoform X2 [Latimeria chalumnae]
MAEEWILIRVEIWKKKKSFLHLDGLYNEDRNLLRIKERERRNQEAPQEKEPFLESTPLFGEPYKTNKGDELSSRIQSMLGNYEEVKELISNRSHQNLIGIPKSAVPLTPQGKSDRPFFADKTSGVAQHQFHSITQRPMDPPSSTLSSVSCSKQHQKKAPPTEQSASLHSKTYNSSHVGSQAEDHSCSSKESYTSHLPKRGDKHTDLDSSAKFSSSLSKLSLLLPSLSPPAEPLSPLHSNQHISSKAYSSNIQGKACSRAKSPRDPDTGLCEKETREPPSSVASLTVAAQPSAQTFPSSLPSKTNTMPKKPTAYVRPMDGQDQAPSESPELKPSSEDYHGQTYENVTDLKANAKAKLSKLKIPSEPIEEMTHSWPPPLTAIHTPSTAEPCKFPFPTKEVQPVPSGFIGQKRYDASSKTLPSTQQDASMLKDDLQLSDSEDSEEERVSEKPVPAAVPTSAPSSQPNSVASAHSSVQVSQSSSESDSSSGSESESESSSSESEGNEPTETVTPEPDTPTANKWQLRNWLTKVSQPATSTECLSDSTYSHGPQESKEQKSNVSQDHPEVKESCSIASSSESRAVPESTPSKNSRQKAPTQSDSGSQRRPVDKKHPKKPTKAAVSEEVRGTAKVKSEPVSHRAKDQPATEKPKVKTKGRPKSTEKREPKSSTRGQVEKKKHTSSQQPAPKSPFVTDSDKDEAPCPPASCSATAPQSHSIVGGRTSSNKPSDKVPEGSHKEKLLPVQDSRLLSPLRDTEVSGALVVKIELNLLSRIPQPPGKGQQKKSSQVDTSERKKSEPGKEITEKSSSKPHRKRKGEEDEESKACKKLKLSKESNLSSSHKEVSRTKVSKPSCVKDQKELLPLPMSAVPKATKAAHKRRNGESHMCNAVSTPNAKDGKSKSSRQDPSLSKHKKVKGKHAGHSKSNKETSENHATPFPVPSLPNGSPKSIRPHLKFEDKQYSVEHNMKEAKKLKHKADAMSDKIGKAFSYLDAAMSFIESGIAMESDTQIPKSAYTIFSETVDLIKYTMRLKSFVEPSAPTPEKTFAVLCMRCLSLLYMAMFRYKRETAIKYSRTLSEHFKSSSRAAQAPSPYIARSTGTPSPLSPMPSPASSGSSQPGSNASSSNGGGSGSSGSSSNSVSIPQMIHQVASSYVNITSLFLSAHDTWEQADALAKKNKEFFVELNAVMGCLALNSSMTELVHYTRQGLHWLRLDTSMP